MSKTKPLQSCFHYERDNKGSIACNCLWDTPDGKQRTCQHSNHYPKHVATWGKPLTHNWMKTIPSDCPKNEKEQPMSTDNKYVGIRYGNMALSINSKTGQVKIEVKGEKTHITSNESTARAYLKSLMDTRMDQVIQIQDKQDENYMYRIELWVGQQNTHYKTIVPFKKKPTQNELHKAVQNYANSLEVYEYNKSDWVRLDK